MGLLNIRVSGLTCVPPILTASMIGGGHTYQLDWNYNGIDYSVVDPTTSISIMFSKGSSSNYQVIDIVPYTTQSYVIDDTVEANKTVYIKIKLNNRTCEEESNEFAFIR